MSLVRSCHAKSVSGQVCFKSSLSLFGLCLDFTFVNKLHLCSSLHSPSVESLQLPNSSEGITNYFDQYSKVKIVIIP